MYLQVTIKDMVNNVSATFKKDIKETKEDIEKLKQHFQLDFKIYKHTMVNFGHTLTYDENEEWHIKFPDIRIVEDSDLYGSKNSESFKSLLFDMEKESIIAKRERFNELQSKHRSLAFMSQELLDEYKTLQVLYEHNFIENYHDKIAELEHKQKDKEKATAKAEYDEFIEWFYDNKWEEIF